MGAHSLGRAHKENTGYTRPWTPGREEVLDNEFFRLMIENGTQFVNKVSICCVYINHSETVYQPLVYPIVYHNSTYKLHDMDPFF